MANTAANVSFGKPKATGAVYVAPAGTSVPTDATTSLAITYKSLGYVSEDGLVNEIETDTEEIKAWGGDTVLSDQTSFKETFTVNLLETNEEALKLYYGAGNVTVSGTDITVQQSSAPLPSVVVIFEVVLTGLLNGWKIRPDEADHTLNVVDGILYVVGGGDPFVDTIGAYTVRISYQAPINVLTITSGSSVLPTDVTDIANAVEALIQPEIEEILSNSDATQAKVNEL